LTNTGGRHRVACANVDRGPFVANADQADADANGIGDACQ
jgi:hypothetical protein